MKVAVIGSGVIGTTTAYYLTRAGVQVEVLECREGPGLETSYANAGQVSTGYSAPWAAPGLPLKAIKWIFSKHAPLRVSPRLDPSMLRFMVAMLGNCTTARYTLNKQRMLRLAEHSRRCLGELREATGIDYDQRCRGTLQLFRTRRQLEQADRDTDVLTQSGIPFELLDADGCVRVEPALARVQGKIAGGLRLSLDETGDCFKFTQALAALTSSLGARFRYGVRVQGLVHERGRVRALITDQGSVEADRYVLAAGIHSVALVRGLGIDLPIYPVKGYSITVPVTDPEAAPVSTVMDETHKVALTRLGERIRVAGTAELTGEDLSLTAARFETIDHVLRDLFPDGGDLAQVSRWAGLRPMTPDGPPVIGPSAIPNLYLNTGHGSLGWTMSCGSGQVLADLVTGRAPAISLEGLTLARYH